MEVERDARRNFDTAVVFEAHFDAKANFRGKELWLREVDFDFQDLGFSVLDLKSETWVLRP